MIKFHLFSFFLFPNVRHLVIQLNLYRGSLDPVKPVPGCVLFALYFFCLHCDFLFVLYFFVCVVFFCLRCTFLVYVVVFCLHCTFLFALWFFVCVVFFCLHCTLFICVVCFFCLLCSVALFCLRCTFLFVLYFLFALWPFWATVLFPPTLPDMPLTILDSNNLN